MKKNIYKVSRTSIVKRKGVLTMTVKRTIFTALLILIFLLAITFDVTWAAEQISNDDTLMGRDGFAEQTSKFKNVTIAVLIIGLGISSYIFYKKEK